MEKKTVAVLFYASALATIFFFGAAGVVSHFFPGWEGVVAIALPSIPSGVMAAYSFMFLVLFEIEDRVA